jgi:1-acyl-sn-glycerol-3-phosphate acyltransferase
LGTLHNTVNLSIFQVYPCAVFIGNFFDHRQPQAGAALLAARAGVPLLPVAIINSHRALGTGQGSPRLVPVHIRIGTPIPAPASRRRPDLDAVTRACQEQINHLLDQGLISGTALPPARESRGLPPSS